MGNRITGDRGIDGTTGRVPDNVNTASCTVLKDVVHGNRCVVGACAIPGNIDASESTRVGHTGHPNIIIVDGTAKAAASTAFEHIQRRTEGVPDRVPVNVIGDYGTAVARERNTATATGDVGVVVGEIRIHDYQVHRGRIDRVLKSLSYREREIIKLRYGLKDGYTYTLEEVGRIFKVTRERVRQIEAKAVRKLQHPIRARKLSGFLDGPELWNQN